jgi:hypothetical protein
MAGDVSERPLARILRRHALALALWTAFACVVWNVVFDRVLVVAGRQYVAAAVVADGASAPRPRLEDWMVSAQRRALGAATAAAAGVLACGVIPTGLLLRRARAAEHKDAAHLSS